MCQALYYRHHNVWKEESRRKGRNKKTSQAGPRKEELLRLVFKSDLEKRMTPK